MARKKMAILGILLGTTAFIGCGQEISNNVIEVEMVSYKPESVAAFEEIQNKFNESHDNIHLTINSPNEAMTILKTRFIKEDYPDIVAIGGDVNYSNFLDADLFMDVSDFEGVKNIKQSYLDMEKEGVEFEKLERLTLGTLRKAVVDGDVKQGTVMAGQIAGLVSKEQTCEEIIKELMKEVSEVYNSHNKLA